MLSIYKSSLEQDLIAKVEPVLETLGYRVRDLEVVGQGSPIVRVTIDFPYEVSDKAIGVDDCERVHKKLGPMFDVWDPIPGAYTLEMSSPGEHAPLRTLADFQALVGQPIKFKTLEAIPMPEPMKPRKNWVGVLVSCTEHGELEIQDDYGLHTVNLSMISHAQWQRDWTASKKKGGI